MRTALPGSSLTTLRTISCIAETATCANDKTGARLPATATCGHNDNATADDHRMRTHTHTRARALSRRDAIPVSSCDRIMSLILSRVACLLRTAWNNHPAIGDMTWSVRAWQQRSTGGCADRRLLQLQPRVFAGAARD
jgi:hypothetical protein